MSTEQSSSSKGRFIVVGIFVLVIAAGLWFGRDLKAPVEETNRRLEAVKAAVLAYAREEGEAPADLEVVVAGGYLEVIPENRSGHPLVYTRLGGGEVEIKSLGPDGKEGGFMFKRDHTMRFAVPEK